MKTLVAIKKDIKTDPLFMVQVFCFIIFYSVWNLPRTNFIFYLGLILGCVISIFTINENRRLFISKYNIAVFLFLILMGWLIFHLKFFSYDYKEQLYELLSIWKKTAIAAIFGLGFGINFAKNFKSRSLYWLTCMGLLTPSFIFMIKYLLTLNFASSIPDYLYIPKERITAYYIPKPEYTTFFMPLVACSLSILLTNISKNFFPALRVFVAVLIILWTLLSLHLYQIKNGFLYSFILISFFIILILIKLKLQIRIKNLIFLGAFLAAMSFIGIKHLEKNQSWVNFIADAKVAVKIDTYDSWKYFGINRYPVNERGHEVYGTNYERVAWAIVGSRLLLKYPMGYGLLNYSFSKLGKIEWSDSKLHQSHISWLDLGLGIGIPGLLIILTILFLTIFWLTFSGNRIYLMNSVPVSYHSCIAWILISNSLVWLSSEVNFGIALPFMFMWIFMGVGYCYKIDNDYFLKFSNA